MGLIKDIYSPAFYNSLADTVAEVMPSFDRKGFMTNIFGDDFENKEWKERMKHTTRVFHEFMPADFSEATAMIEKVINQLRIKRNAEGGLAHIFFADYVETYGLDDLAASIKALEFITQYISCEFAVRPFMLKYGDRMLAQMTKWSLHPSAAVRRLASEGSRPRLPWAMALPALKKDPAPLLPLLENLKNDPSESVRRSVANNLNDIAKDHPEVVIAIAARWKGVSKETDAIIKHGCRTLLKQGHTEVLAQYGLKSENILVENFKVLTPEVKIGDSLVFTFSIVNANPDNRTVRLEYGLYYQKSKGHLARKVFKISERVYQAGAVETIHRKQSFKVITTRVFHPGLHQVAVIVNGEEKGLLDFTLQQA